MMLEAKKQSQEEKISEYQKKLEALHATCKELKDKLNGRVTAEKHSALVNELKRYVYQ